MIHSESGLYQFSTPNNKAIYNAVKNELYINGMPVMPTFNKDSYFGKHDRVFFTTPERCSLYITLTNTCNFRCGYCMFGCDSKNDFENIDYEKLCKNIVRYYGNKKIDSMRFFGGEPLCNKQGMVEIINWFKKNYPYEQPKYAIITNGSLLDKDTCDFMLENKVLCTLSHDGVSQQYRGNINVLENPKLVNFFKLLKSDNMFNISSVMHKHTAGIKKNVEYFIEKLGSENLCIVLYNVLKDDVGGHNTDSQLLLATEEDFQKYHEEYYEAVLQYNQVIVSVLGHLNKFLRDLNNPQKTEVFAKGNNRLTVHVNGDIVETTNAGERSKGIYKVVGSIYKGNVEDFNKNNYMIPYEKISDKCEKCLIRTSCTACWNKFTKQNYGDYNCKSEWYTMSALLKYFISFITNEKVIGVGAI